VRGTLHRRRTGPRLIPDLTAVSRGGTVIGVVTEVVLKIIEEFSDGFLILNEDGRIVFFNELLLKTMGLRSADVFAHEADLLSHLGIASPYEPSEREVLVEDRGGTPRRLLVSTLAVDGSRGQYILARIKTAPSKGNGSSGLARKELEQLFRNIGDPLITADLGGVITCANPSFYKMIEWEQGKDLPNIAELYAHSAELEDKILRLAESDMVFNLDTHLVTRGKEPRRVLDTSWVLRDDRGVVTGYTTHFKDLTYVKNLETRLKISERNYIVLFDTILSSIVLIDPSGKILNCNYYAEEMYGYGWADLVGKHFDEVFHVHDKSLRVQEIIALVDGNKGRYVETDVPRACRDGSIKFTYASYSALTSTTGEIIAYAVMERDLSERVRLEKKLQDSFQQIKDTQSAAILGFARLTEYRDMDTGKHLERLREYTRVLALGLAKLPRYTGYITADYVDDLCLSSVLHDVGKVGIEDSVLRKPGKLSPAEFEKIKQHARLGGEALSAVDKELKHESFLTIGKEIAFSHHERWDGSGYPAGKKQDQIPLSARIVALADVYDALTSKRSYKDALSHEEAARIIMTERGTHFDPEIVDVFAQNLDTFRRIHMLESFKADLRSMDDILKAGRT
jgi:PAS domain S-box-containing protein